MTARDFVIKRFETNNPEILKIIEVWSEFSIKENHKGLWVFLSPKSFPQCPESKWLNADIDAETHYKLSRTYDRLFYKIHKLELEQGYLQAVVEEEVQEEAEM